MLYTLTYAKQPCTNVIPTVVLAGAKLALKCTTPKNSVAVSDHAYINIAGNIAIRRIPAMSNILYDKIWYLPTSLVAKDGSVTLLVHRYQIRQGSINVIISNKLDALEFSSKKEMAEEITRKRYRALPPEADGNPQYIPRRIKTLKAKYEATRHA